MSNRTFTMIKPDAFKNGHAGAILDRILQEGYSIKALKMTKLTPEKAGEFYAIHKERPFIKNWFLLCVKDLLLLQYWKKKMQ